MKDRDDRPEDAAGLRARAEEAARKEAARYPDDLAGLSPEEAGKVVHDLRVHQIELEMQNEELRRAQEELDASRARYFDLYDLAPVGYCTVSEKGLILEANLTAASLLGVARSALVKKPISRFILKEDQDIYYLRHKHLSETGTPQECDLRLVKPDDTFFWAQMAATAAQGEDGSPLCRVVISDITGRKRAEEPMRLHMMMFECSTEAIAISDAEGRLVYVNPAHERLFGRSLAEARGLDYRAYYPPESIEVLDKEVAPALAQGKHWEGELDALDSAGRRFPLWERADAMLDTDGRMLFAFGFMHETSEQRRAKKALRENEERLRLALKATRDVVWDWDILHDSQLWNESGGAVFGWTDIVQAPQTAGWWMERVHPEDRQRVAEAFFAAVHDPTGERWADEYRFRKADGTDAYVVDRGYILRDADGQAVRMIGAMRDVTEHKEAEGALRHSQQLLDATESMSGTGGWEWDVATQTMTWTNGAYRIHDLDPASISSGSPEHIAHSLACYDPEDRARVEEAFRRCVEEGQAYDLELGFTTTAGLRLRLRTMGHPVRENGRIVKVQGNLQDITQLRRAEKALRNSEQFHLAILDGFSDNVAVLDEHGTILFVNEPWRRFAEANGASAASVSEGVNYLHVCDNSFGDGAEEARSFGEAIRRVLAGERESIALEYTCHSPTEDRWYEGRVMAVRFETGARVAVAHQDITGRRRSERALEEQRELLRSLGSRLVGTEEQERKRIASYLHDEVGQSLAALRVNLATWKGTKSPAQRRRLLRDIEGLLDETIDETRSLTFELSPPLLFELGLGPALDALGERLFSGTTTSFAFHDDGLGGELSDTFASGLYRIGREALLNALKHADAGNVSISLSAAGNRLCLVVKDDGKGMESGHFQKALRGRGGTFGLFSINERLHHLGGTIEIVSSPGKGTCVTITAPLANAEPRPKGDLP